MRSQDYVGNSEEVEKESTGSYLVVRERTFV
jgi:hypothetical protein